MPFWNACWSSMSRSLDKIQHTEIKSSRVPNQNAPARCWRMTSRIVRYPAIGITYELTYLQSTTILNSPGRPGFGTIMIGEDHLLCGLSWDSPFWQASRYDSSWTSCALVRLGTVLFWAWQQKESLLLVFFAQSNSPYIFELKHQRLQLPRLFWIQMSACFWNHFNERGV
jgi:hypothetical protein